MGLFAQIQAFLLTFILGIIVGLIFHYYQLTIRSMGVGKYPLYLMDLILWIIMIIFIASALLLINQGEMRVYVFIALLIGGLVYYKCLARHLQQPIYVLGRATAFMVKAICANLTRPVIWAITWLRARHSQRQTPPPDDPSE